MLAHEELQRILNYNPDTGVFTIKVALSRSTKVGNTTGSKNNKGYVWLSVHGKLYAAHRLAWFYVTGKWPEKEIDHINGIKHDNRFSNLRDVSRTENRRNQKMRKDNKSGYQGVHWHKKCQKWQVTIGINGEVVCLGRYDDLIDAVSVRMSAERDQGYHENHGKSPL